MSFVVNASAEELAKLFHHYQEALAGDFATAPSCRAPSWEKTWQKERDLKIAPVRMALLQLAETRGEYLSDRGGFISGRTQALKESTLTYEYKFADGFLARAEWRRDFSNQPFFLTETPRIDVVVGPQAGLVVRKEDGEIPWQEVRYAGRNFRSHFDRFFCDVDRVCAFLRALEVRGTI